jgi:hypothetical protein
MPVRYTLISRPTYSIMLDLYTLTCQFYIPLYANPLYSEIPVLYIGKCRSYKLYMRTYLLVYASPLYSDRPVRQSLICRSYILLYTGSTYS